MSDHDENGVSREQFELSRRRFLRNLGAAAAAVPALGFLTEGLMDMPASASTVERAAAGRRLGRNAAVPEGVFAAHPGYKFTFVNHVTTNPFFVPTRYGAQDACTLLGCSYSWQGSATSDVGQMVSAFNAAVAGRVDGIASTIIDKSAFIAPTNRALSSGIPVVAYNASAPSATASQNHQMAYIGQDLFQAGVEAGKKILQVVKKGDLVAGFIATPGSLNIQPRIDGAASVLRPAGVNFPEVATGALLSQEATATEAWYLGHKNVKFMYAVDAGSTSSAAAVVEKHNLKGKVFVGGFDFLPTTVGAVQSGSQLWTIDQQPYLQGFLPVLQLFMYNVSGGLVAPVPVDTGLKFVEKPQITPYTKKDRYEGSSTSAVTLKPPSTISA
ncbi:MAG: substrate-binding domain-containing protein [Actinomycetota bacterium]|nr:substrate-binding domain-containing protein [Actinomycetota bacterium]